MELVFSCLHYFKKLSTFSLQRLNDGKCDWKNWFVGGLNFAKSYKLGILVSLFDTSELCI